MHETDLELRPRFNFERFALIYAPLMLAWWMGIRSIGNQLNNLAMGILIGTVVIFIVGFMVRRIEITIYNGNSSLSALKYLFLSLFPLFITLGSNFNIIYPFVMEATLLNEELVEKRAALTSLESELVNYKADAEFTVWEAKVDGLTNQLVSQITSVENLGAGKLSEAIINDLEKELNHKITRHVVINRRLDVAQKIASRYKADIEDIKKHHPRYVKNTGETLQLAPNIKKVKDAINGINTASLAIKNSTKDWQNIAILSIRNAADTHNDVVSELREKFPPSSKVSQSRLQVTAEGFGKFEHTFASAMANLGRGGTWAAVLLALILDLWGPILALFYTKQAPELWKVDPNMRTAQEDQSANAKENSEEAKEKSFTESGKTSASATTTGDDEETTDVNQKHPKENTVYGFNKLHRINFTGIDERGRNE